MFAQDGHARFRDGNMWPDAIAGANKDEKKGAPPARKAAYTLINARRIWDASKGSDLGYGSDQNYPVKDVFEHELKSLNVMFSMQDIFRIVWHQHGDVAGDVQDQIGTLTPGKRARILCSWRVIPLRIFTFC